MFTSGDRLTPANRIRKPSILLQYPILFYRLAEKAFLLLNKQKISQQAKELMFPLDWHLIADGRFTVESDRATVVKLGEVALESAMVMDFLSWINQWFLQKGVFLWVRVGGEVGWLAINVGF